jgi:LysR family transcriptional regulator (chromosome initiation inhibitor)
MLDYALLSALAAVMRTGSFERAAQQLKVTPSAISQRVKLLEERLGTVLVVRGQPCTGTQAGQRLCQHCEQVALLEAALHETLPGLAPIAQPVTLRIAVTADSLATWFIAAMAQTDGILFDLVVDDQDHSADWLRRGEVLAAVTGYGEPLQGCDCRVLGALRYVAAASPAFVQRWFPDGVGEAAATLAPCLTFNRKDRLQQQWLRQAVGKEITPPTHWLPSSQAFVDGALADLGWGMIPESLAAGHLPSGRLVALASGLPLDVPLYWQYNRIVGEALADVTRAVMRLAGATLIPVP